jgi:hypothetical protein
MVRNQRNKLSVAKAKIEAINVNYYDKINFFLK